jgi:hypothetical protein
MNGGGEERREYNFIGKRRKEITRKNLRFIWKKYRV